MATATNPAKATPAKKAAPAKKAPARPAAKAAPPAKVAAAPEIEPGWYKDPADPTALRYWDGKGWLGAPLPESIVTGAVPAAEVPTAATTEGVPVAAFITWQGRRMPVRRPSAGMIGVWHLAGRDLQQKAANGQDMTGLQVADVSGRTIRVCTSVLAEQDDKDWVMDLLTDGKVDLDDLAGILTLTNDEYQKVAESEANREERRATLKASRR